MKGQEKGDCIMSDTEKAAGNQSSNGSDDDLVKEGLEGGNHGNESDGQEGSARTKSNEDEDKKKTSTDNGETSSILDYSSDKAQFLRIFPVEIWEMIFDELDISKNHSELLALSNSSLYLRQLLLPRQTEFLFPSVLKALNEQKLLVEFPEDLYSIFTVPYDDINQQIGRCNSCGRIRCIKWFSEILKLRLVCRAWAKGVNEICAEAPNLFCNEEDTVPLGEGISQVTRCTFTDYSTESFQTFCNHFGRTHLESRKSPLIGNSLSIVYEWDVNANIFLDNLDGFLEKYGKFVKNCAIKDKLGPAIGYYERTHRILTRLDTIIFLQIYCAPLRWNNTVSVAERLQIMESISANPLPNLEHLESLETENLPVYMFNELLRTNPQISTLKLRFHPADRYHVLYTVPLPNLTELSIEFQSEVEFHRILNHPNVNWPLKKLDLQVGHFSRTGKVSWFQVLSVIQSKWGETLTDLFLKIAKPTEDFSDPFTVNVSLHLKKLQRLKLVVPHCVPLDFILPMQQTLKYLEVKILNEEGVNRSSAASAEAGKTIQFFTSIQSPSGSNIWKLLPKLSTLRFIEDGINNQGRNSWTLHRRDLRDQAEIRIIYKALTPVENVEMSREGNQVSTYCHLLHKFLFVVCAVSFVIFLFYFYISF